MTASAAGVVRRSRWGVARRQSARLLVAVLAICSVGLILPTTGCVSLVFGVAMFDVSGAFTLSPTSGGNSTLVRVTLTQVDTGLPHTLEPGQAIEFNGVALTNESVGVYAATIPTASTYQIRVIEPRVGVDLSSIATTSLSFAILAPVGNSNQSLAGFDLTWSNPSASGTMDLLLSQTQFGTPVNRTVSQLADDGAYTLAAADLQPFVQGFPLQLSLTRSAQQSGAINGLRSSTVSIRTTQTVSVNPAP